MALTLPWPAPARAADGVEIGELVAAASVPEAQRRLLTQLQAMGVAPVKQ